MSATSNATGSAVCGAWMPRKQTYCARGAGHPPPCASPEAMEAQRQRSAERRPARVVTPESKARWNRTHKFVRFSITQDRFNQMLEAQGNACAICREPFQDQRICFDHDHSCCPIPASGHTISCGKCLRGLLCVQCNTRLGWLETYGSTIRAYLAGQGED